MKYSKLFNQLFGDTSDDGYDVSKPIICAGKGLSTLFWSHYELFQLHKIYVVCINLCSALRKHHLLLLSANLRFYQYKIKVAGFAFVSFKLILKVCLFITDLIIAFDLNQ